MCFGNRRRSNTTFTAYKTTDGVDTCPMCRGGANFSTMKLRIEGPRAVFTQTLMNRIFWLWLIGLPAYGIYFCFFKLKHPSNVENAGLELVFNLAILLVTGGMICLGYLGLSVGFGVKRVTADSTRRIVEIESGFDSLLRWSGAGKRSLFFDDIAAVQICTIDDKYGTEGPRWSWEINLVLNNPSGRRINLLAHSNSCRIRDEAAQFAAFLGKPLLDHTDPARESSFSF